jgi:hypothetical protein
MAIVELRAHKECVETMLAQGFSKKLIHEKLTSEGKFTMSYITFCQKLRKEKALEEAAKALPAAPAVRPPHRPAVIHTGEQPFQDPRTVDPKTLI